VLSSGCAAGSKFSVTDYSKDENVPKFKNSWFCHDNIVTCSRDGSAIIWIPRLRRSHVTFSFAKITATLIVYLHIVYFHRSRKSDLYLCLSGKKLPMDTSISSQGSTSAHAPSTS
jgi:hypothetical protein